MTATGTTPPTAGPNRTRQPDDEVIYLVGEDRRGIPAEMVSTVLRAIGAVYPHTMMGPGHPLLGGLSLRVSAADRRRPKRLSKKAAEELLGEEDVQDPVRVQQFEDATLTFTGPEEGMRVLAAAAHAALSGAGDDPPVANYVESLVTCADGRQLVVSAAWSTTQTPHQLRVRAEQELKVAQDRIAVLEQQLAERGEPST